MPVYASKKLNVFGLLLEMPSSGLQSEGLQGKRALAGLWGRRSPFTTQMCTCIDDEGRGDEDGDNPPPWSLY